MEITGWPGHFRKSFDAYAIHPYYDGHNYDSIPFDHLETTYSCNLGDTISTNDGWRYDIYDERLEATLTVSPVTLKILLNPGIWNRGMSIKHI